MNRIKIMLAATAVLAIVGGTLAFKARTFSLANIYCSTFPATPGPTCQLQTPTNYTSQAYTGAIAQNNPCGAGISFYTENACNTAYTTVAGSNRLLVYLTDNQ